MSGFYQLPSSEYLNKYTKQTRSSFHDRYKECIVSYKYSTTNSAFEQHLLDNGHLFGPNEEIMGTLHFTRKRTYMNNFENSYIYCESVKDHQINGKTTPRTKKIFVIIVHYETTAHSDHYIEYGSATGVHPWTTNAVPYHTTVAATFLQHNSHI